MTERRHTTARACGYTLVEVLIVTTIILLLVALALPAISEALAYSSTLSCANNLKQIGRAVAQYQRAHQGRIPPAATVANGEADWCYVLVLEGYIEAPNADIYADDHLTRETNPFICPNTVDLRVEHTVNVASPDADEAQGWYRVGDAHLKVDCSYYWNGSTAAPKSTAAILNPTDSTPDDRYPSMAWDATAFHSVSEMTRGGDQFVMAADGVWSDGADDPERIAARHNGAYGDRTRTNLIFYDGHVESLDRVPQFDWDDDPILIRDALQGLNPQFVFPVGSSMGSSGGGTGREIVIDG